MCLYDVWAILDAIWLFIGEIFFGYVFKSEAELNNMKNKKNYAY